MKCILDVHKYMAEWMPTVTLKHENIYQCKCSKWLPFSFKQSMNLWITEQATLLQRWGEIVLHSPSMTAFKSVMVLGLRRKTLSLRTPQRKKSGGLKSGDLGGHPIGPRRLIHREVVIQPLSDTKAVMGRCSILLK